ncbi:DUF4412 domain-containing protein [Sphingobacterium wenxiniae]|uniref:DUF4412 domain-containing protein n=1 Tax=Sphingobacterium wenxiniae TaxID=683125 RepID=A0A1I6VQS6_9SPHI|nr:DUF4412 domain-containing protein [Sphingobacterium wenxiniae]SFT16080.1 protein of unknown function [Sphingobacterium wenxiniae]
MKKNVCIIGLLLLVFLLPQTSDAQLLKGLGKKLEKKVEQQINNRVERQADKAINKGMDKVENAAEGAIKGSGNRQPNADGEPSSDVGNIDFPIGKSDVTLYDTYDFTLGVTYQTQGSKGRATEMTMWFGGEDYIGMSAAQEKDMFMVMHGASMIAFMEKEKSYMVLGGGMTAGVLGAAVEEAEDDTFDGEFSIKKIGSESILNYNCDVYEATTSEYTTTLWLTTELGVDAGHFMSAFGQLTKISKGGMPNLQNQAGGILLKMEGKSLKDNDSMRMEATAIDKEGKSIHTKDYKSFGF